jgi:CheY-like chemotaxis protein
MNGRLPAPGLTPALPSPASAGQGTLRQHLAEREAPGLPVTADPGRAPNPGTTRPGGGVTVPMAVGEERPVVLVVDDFEPVRMLLARYLDRMGFRMIAVGDAQGAIEALDAEPVDHVLLDVNLPGGSRRVYEHIRGTKNGLRERTAFITGGFVEADSEAFVRETGCPALFKPFDLHQLRALFQS